MLAESGARSLVRYVRLSPTEVHSCRSLAATSSGPPPARAFTTRAFESAGYPPAASQTNFVMVDLRRDAKPFRESSKRENVLVGRPFPPLTTYVRVTVGTMDEMRRAADVFRRALATV